MPPPTRFCQNTGPMPAVPCVITTRQSLEVNTRAPEPAEPSIQPRFPLQPRLRPLAPKPWPQPRRVSRPTSYVGPTLTPGAFNSSQLLCLAYSRPTERKHFCLLYPPCSQNFPHQMSAPKKSAHYNRRPSCLHPGDPGLGALPADGRPNPGTRDTPGTPATREVKGRRLGARICELEQASVSSSVKGRQAAGPVVH